MTSCRPRIPHSGGTLGIFLNPSCGEVDRAQLLLPSVTAEDLALLSDEQLEELREAAYRLQQLISADRQRRRDELAAKFEVLGKDATATCLRHKRLVRWMASPTWWYHADFEFGTAESRRCAAMWNVKAPIVITRIAD